MPACCKPPPSLVCGSRRQGDWFAHGAIRFLRGSGSTVRGSKSTLIRLAVCRSPSPPSPTDEGVDDGGCAGVSRGRLTRGDMANADRSSRPSLPCPPEVWPSQPARRSEPTRTRPNISHSPPPHLSPPTSTHPLVSDCTVPCRYVVHPGYAYPSALLWADLLIIKSVLLKTCSRPSWQSRHISRRRALRSPQAAQVRPTLLT